MAGITRAPTGGRPEESTRPDTPDVAGISRYIDEQGNLTLWAKRRWLEHLENHKVEIPDCCSNPSDSYTMGLVAWLAAGCLYPDLEIKSTPMIMVHCDSCGRTFTFSANTVFPEFRSAVERSRRERKESQDDH